MRDTLEGERMRTCPRCSQRYSDSETFCSRDGTELSEPDGTITDPLLGQSVEGYVIEDLLGEGGMGIVYRATKPPDQKVALKVLRSEYTQNQDILARFHQEAMAVNQIRHQNIVNILSLGVLERGSPYILMEHLEGKDLGSVLDEEGRLEATRATRIARQVAEALLAAHEAGVIHRDLKPENIFLVSPKETVKVLDFGIAKLTRKPDIPHSGSRETARTHTGVIIGTPQYMSPEQASGKPAIPQTDIYALGVIFYEMLTGQVPFRSPDGPLHILMQHINEEPPPPRKIVPDIPPALERVILCCLQKDWQSRYASMRALLEDLSLIQEGKEPIHAPPYTAAPAVLPASSTSLTLGMIASLLLVLVLGGSLYASGLLSAKKPGPAPEAVEPSEASLAATEIDQAPPSEESLPTSFPHSVAATTLSQTVTVRLVTDPPGAQIVMEGNAQELKTPTLLVLPKQDREVLFSFRLEGYEEREERISLAEDAEISLKLSPLSVRPPGKKPGEKTPPPQGEEPKNPPPPQGDEVKKPPPDQLDPYGEDQEPGGRK